MEFLKCSPKWTRQPKQVQIDENKVVMVTEKGTDLKMIMLRYFRLRRAICFSLSL